VAKRGTAEKSLVQFDYPRPRDRQKAPTKVGDGTQPSSEVIARMGTGAGRAVTCEKVDCRHLPTPVNPIADRSSGSGQMSANVWSKLFPSLLVIMALTGAFYPAVDLGAGEKERERWRTLLICPATRTEIVLGKFLTVMLFSASTLC